VYSGVPGAGVRWLCPLSVKHSRGRAHCDGVQGATTLRRRRRAVSGAQDRALGCVPTPARPVTSPPPRSAAAEAGAARRRGGGDSSRRHRQGGVPVHSHWGLPSRPSAGHQQRQKKARGDGVGRRPKTPPDDQDERSPARATAAAVVVSVTEALERGRGNGTRETAQELQHGCGEDCWRSASLAALHARPRALH